MHRRGRNSVFESFPSVLIDVAAIWIWYRIKQLVAGVNLSVINPIFGDPKQLESVKLSDLHPASWYVVVLYLPGYRIFQLISPLCFCFSANRIAPYVFRFCVAWYPICQIPSTAGSSQAAFLTYHSLGKLVPKTCSTDIADGLIPIVCRIVGLLSYKNEVAVDQPGYIVLVLHSYWGHHCGNPFFTGREVVSTGRTTRVQAYIRRLLGNGSCWTSEWEAEGTEALRISHVEGGGAQGNWGSHELPSRLRVLLVTRSLTMRLQTSVSHWDRREAYVDVFYYFNLI